ncbi:MAG TPA: hypothetical protein VM183_11180 [Burkholderiales bacterium]|nr:hypothetical protein [Burkholderiales bacterium]
MTLYRMLVVAAALAAAPAWAQQAKTTEQQARSYILSAFMTGAAPMVLSDDLKVAAPLRERLRLAPEADSRAVYSALIGMTAGRSLHVRPARAEEMQNTEAQVQPGKPVFALDVANSTFVLQYDLERDTVTYLADSTKPVAVTSPVAEPAPPQQIPEAPKPAPEPAAVAPAPEAPQAPAPAAPAVAAAPPVAVQIVEPREPRFAAPVPPPVTPAPVVQAPVVQASGAPARAASPQERLRPTGACVIKPVMSDQDLVNCGATPR